MTLTPSLGGRFLARLQHHNPFYFLSAACMLAGILAVTNSLPWTSIPLTRLLVLIATLNIYEAALIGLAFYLVKGRNLVRDGIMLLALEAFFLIDITFLNAEIATSHWGLGLIINIILFIAAIAKLSIIGSMIGLPARGGRFAAMVLQIAALFALPVIFRWADQGELSARVFYAAWWALGLLIPLSQWICTRSEAAPTAPWGRRMVLFYLVMPWLSLVLHLSIMRYVYGAEYFGADAAPILLALAFVLHRAEPSRLIPRKDLNVLKLLLPIAALLVSLNDPHQLCFSMAKNSAFWITPSHLAIGAVYLTYVYFYAGRFAIHFIAAGGITELGFIYGTTVERWLNWCYDVLSEHVPTTTLAWGIASIAAAYAFLGIGAAISLGKRSTPPQES